MALTTPVLAEALARLAPWMRDAAARLNALDGQLGDGDLGVTVSAGTEALAALAPALPADLGQAFMACAQAWMKVSSSSFGTLTATALMAAAKASKGETELPWSRMAPLLAGARDAMMARGKASLGDKTVLDVLDAAATAAAAAAEGEMLAAVEEAVRGVMERMRDTPAKVGRARIFAEKSVGMDDPGMVAFAEMLRGLRGS
jgi:dihydroxyacetone kinase-like protein